MRSRQSLGWLAIRMAAACETMLSLINALHRGQCRTARLSANLTSGGDKFERRPEIKCLSGHQCQEEISREAGRAGSGGKLEADSQWVWQESAGIRRSMAERRTCRPGRVCR